MGFQNVLPSLTDVYARQALGAELDTYGSGLVAGVKNVFLKEIAAPALTSRANSRALLTGLLPRQKLFVRIVHFLDD